MTSTSPSDQLLYIRYRVIDTASVFVTIQRVDEERPTSTGTLVEISSSSARIVSNVPFQFGEKLVLCLTPEPMGFSISIGCDVQSIRHVKEDEWIVQCLFGSRLEPQLLETYVEHGLLERRSTDRLDVALPASIQLEGSADAQDVTLYDIGAGGFSFQSDTERPIGARLRLILREGDGEEIEGRIMWQSEDGDQYRIGCQWLNHKGSALARRFADNTLCVKDGGVRRSMHPLLAAIAVAAIAFYLGTFFKTGIASLLSILPVDAASWSFFQ